MPKFFRSPVGWIAVVLVMEAIVVYSIGPRPRERRSIFTPGPHPFANRLGQNGMVPELNAVALVVFFYLWKLEIVRKVKDKQEAVGWYLLLILVCLPYLWYLVSTNWFNQHAYDVAVWIGTPIQVLFIPTLSFMWYLIDKAPPSPHPVNVIVEMIILVPVWYFIWPILSFFCCGFYWI